MPDLSLELENAHRGVIAGVDEAGRGPLAGPVVAGAVILNEGFFHESVNDSKKLSESKREKIYEELADDQRLVWAVGISDAREIEEVNILRATHLAMARAIEGLPTKPDFCLIDGLAIPKFAHTHLGVVKGDSRSLSIAAASIFAKVTRDRLMRQAAEDFPGYGFERHKGYGTAAHLEALRSLGPCPLHRRSFQPVAQLTLPLGEAGEDDSA